jgi:Ca2+-binding RTX toxin-like protein
VSSWLNGQLAQTGGTSQAAPHVAGLVALMQDLAMEMGSVKLSVDTVLKIIRDTSVTIYDGAGSSQLPNDPVENDNLINTESFYYRINVNNAMNFIVDHFKNGKSVNLDVNGNFQNGTSFFGWRADDLLTGRSSSDLIRGNDGNDTMAGGVGADTLDGGSGFDFVSFTNATGGVTARLDFASLNTGEAAGDVYISIEGLIGSIYNDYLVGSDAAGDYLTSQAGDDYIAGRGGNDTILGDAGDDQFWGGEGADVLNGGSGYDIARYDYASSGLTVWLGGGVNTGEAAGDTFSGIEALYGSAFGDFLIGDSVGNVLAGLDGVDFLYGLGGDDVLLGGAAGDYFAFNTAGFGIDTVLDFATSAAAGASHDTVDFRGLSLGSFAITQVGADTHVVTNHGTVILQGVSSSTLITADFLF